MSEKTKFNRVLNTLDVLVTAFGAMIGWGWVVSTGSWLSRAGVGGTVLGFVIGGIMIYFVGLTYAELTTALPQVGGERVFSLRAFGPVGSKAQKRRKSFQLKSLRTGRVVYMHVVFDIELHRCRLL